MRLPAAASAALFFSTLAFAACSSTTDPPPPPPADASTPPPPDASVEASQDAAVCPPVGAPSGPSTWTSLYADFFGPTGKASCAGDGFCHGGPTQEGAKSAFYVCDSKDGCFASMRSKTGVNERDSNLVKDGDVADPKKAALFGVIRLTREDCTQSGFMPKRSPFRFSREDVLRIQAWIAAGANND